MAERSTEAKELSVIAFNAMRGSLSFIVDDINGVRSLGREHCPHLRPLARIA
jgi:hypothetical protein